MVLGRHIVSRDATISLTASNIFSALLVSDPANELLFGRRAAMIFSATCIFAASIGGAVVKDWPALLGCRILLGIGMGCKASVVPVFAAEVAPARMRGMSDPWISSVCSPLTLAGSIVMNWQLYALLSYAHIEMY